MGHVVNPHLFRLNYTVFWNISTFSKKKFSIFIDLKSLIIYNFFNSYLNNYKNIRKIRLRILKIKISFYCNSVKIFFFFIKHKNLNKHFKKMFNNSQKVNNYYIEKLSDLDDFFLLNDNKYTFDDYDDYQDIIYNEYNFDGEKTLFKNKIVDKKNLKSSYKQKNFFFDKKKINFLFANNYGRNLKIDYYAHINKYNHMNSDEQQLRFDFDMLFGGTMNKFKSLVYKNFVQILSYYYNFEYRKFNKAKYFDVLNFNMYEEFIEKNVPCIPIFSDEKDETFLEKEKVIYYLNKKKNRKIFKFKFKKLNFERYVENTISERNRDNRDFKRYKINKFSKLIIKDFFFLNVKKKTSKNNSKSFFANNYYKWLFKKKELPTRAIAEADRNEAKILRNIDDFTNAKKIIFDSDRFKNFKKIHLKDENTVENILIFNSARGVDAVLDDNRDDLFNSDKVNCVIENDEEEEEDESEDKNIEDKNIEDKKTEDKNIEDEENDEENDEKDDEEDDEENDDEEDEEENKKEDLSDLDEINEEEDYVKNKNCAALLSVNLKLNLKVVRNKFLLFNFIKKFLKLKKKMYNIFNRVYLNNISVIITICLKKYSRWKFTADYLNDLMIVRLKQSYKIKDIMRFVIKYLNRVLKKKRILGYAILLKGRFSRKDRAMYQLKRFGKTKKTNKVSIIDFSNKSVNLTYSKAAISIWITRHI